MVTPMSAMRSHEAISRSHRAPGAALAGHGVSGLATVIRPRGRTPARRAAIDGAFSLASRSLLVASRNIKATDR
jgi:hypothetical protein